MSGYIVIDAGYTISHIPQNTGGAVGVLINDRIKLVARLETVNNAMSFASMEMIIVCICKVGS